MPSDGRNIHQLRNDDSNSTPLPSLDSFLQGKKPKNIKISSGQLIKEDELIAEYRRLKKSLGRQPTTTDLNEGKFSRFAYTKIWGTWNLFLKAINEPILHNKSITKKELIDNYKEVKERLGKTPTIKEMNELGEYSTSTHESKFGAWGKFLKSMGDSPVKKHNISKSDFIKEFLRVKSVLGHAPTTLEMIEYGNIAPNSYKRIWGSWSNFLNKQGEKYPKNRKIPDGELVAEYLKLKKQLKKESLTQRDMNDCGKFSSTVYERRFGSWNKFLKHIGDNANVNTNISEKDLIDEYSRIKILLNKNPLSCSDIRKNGNFALSTFSKRFGSWNNFIDKMRST